MIAAVASLFVFLALAAGSVAVLSSRGPGGRASDERIRALGRSGTDSEDRKTPTPAFRRPRSSTPMLRRLLNDSAWADMAATQLQQANIQLRVGEYLLMRLLFGAILFVIPAVALRQNPIGLAVGLAAGAAGFLLPAFYVSSMRGRRVGTIEKQLVDFLPSLASSIRSGFALQQGIETAAQQVGPPLADELSLLINDVELGAPMHTALQDLGSRVGSTSLDMVITAILVQRTTGGNLAEILDVAAETLRERERIRGEVQTLTTQQRLTGTILSVYPIAIFLLLLLIMPSVWSKLFTETPGRIMLGVALSLQVLGFYVMRRALRIEI